MARKPRWRRLPPEVRQEIMRLRARGRTYTQIVAELDVALGSVERVLAPLGGVIRREALMRSPERRLTLEERVEIRLGLERGWSYRRIGAELGRAASTVCR